MKDASKALKSITPKTRTQFHISGINMLNECGKRFEFRYILGIRRPPGFFMAVGSAVHDSVASNLGSKIEKKELLPRKDYIDLAATVFEKICEKDKPELDADDRGRDYKEVRGENKDKSLDLAGVHYDKAAPELNPSQVNRKFSIDMDRWLMQRGKAMHAAAADESDPYRRKLLDMEGAAMIAASRFGMDLAGEQDIVETEVVVLKTRSDEPTLAFPPRDRLIIRDTKTSTKSPQKSIMDGSDGPGIADDSDQLTTYALAELVLDKKLPDLMVLDYLVRTTKRHDLKWIPTKTIRTMEHINTFLNRFANAVFAYRKGIFVPAKADWWGCSEQYCGYWNMCPYAKRPVSTLVPGIKPAEAQ
jgi:hypothetical protein